jgi:hypothetical protein
MCALILLIMEKILPMVRRSYLCFGQILLGFLMMYLSTLANFLYYLLCHSVKNQTEILMASYYLMFERIALVGCDTTNIKQGLARNFAKTIYDNMPALRTAQITGGGGEVEINENGTKTMKTGGTKTVYSWRDGGIVSH